MRNVLSAQFFSLQESLRVCGILLQPIVPDLSAKLLTKLNVSLEDRKWKNAEALSWTQCQKFEKRPLAPENVVLFRKLKE